MSRGNRTTGMVCVAIVVMCLGVYSGRSEATSCRLDWNGDFQITVDDYNNEAKVGGFYAEWYLFLYTPYYSLFFPGADPSRLDYNGDGTIDTGDLMGTLDTTAETEGFFSEWYIFMYTPYYSVFFPEYDTCPPLDDPGNRCPNGETVDIATLTQSVGPIYLGMDNAQKKRTGVVNFYVVSDGNVAAGLEVLSGRDVAGQLEYVDPPREVLVRVLNPDEEIIYWAYYDSEGDLYTSGGEPSLPETFCMSRAGVYQVRVNGAETGPDHPKNRVTLHLSENTEYGVNFQYGFFQNWDGMPEPSFVWAPTHPHEPLQFTLSEYTPDVDIYPPLPIAIYDESAGNAALIPNPSVGIATITLPPSASSDHHMLRVHGRLESGNPMPWRFKVDSGYPFILASSRAAASAIHGSVDKIPSGPFAGRWVPHKFQLEVAEIISELLTHAGDRSDLYGGPVLNYPITQDACVNPHDPEDISKHYAYLHYYQGTLPAARYSLFLDEDNGYRPVHNMEPNSRWLGSYWYDKGAAACTYDRDCPTGNCVRGKCEAEFWDLFTKKTNRNRVAGMGHTTKYGFPSTLIHAALTEHPCNFYGPTATGVVQYPGLMARGVMASLFNLFHVMESDVFLDPPISDAFYGGSYQLHGFQNTVAAFGEAGPYLQGVFPGGLGTRIRTVWTDAVRHIVDRVYTQGIASSMNQTAHLMPSFAYVAGGMEGLPQAAGYRALARRFAERFVSLQNPAGFFMEGGGIDATYSGMQHWAMGTYYRMTEFWPEGPDDLILEAIRESYAFHNHTLALEPSGGFLGSFDFANRTTPDFSREQYSGARKVIEQLGEVSYRVEPADNNNSGLTSQAQNFEYLAGVVALENIDHPGNVGTLPRGQYKDLARRPGDYILPAHETTNFTRNVADADMLIAIKRPRYYATVFVGKPTRSWTVEKFLELFQEPYPTEGLPYHAVDPIGSHGPVFVDEDPEDPPKHVQPFLGGGLGLLHTEQHGATITAANWNPYTHHGLVAEHTDSDTGGTQRRWTRYWSRTFQLDEGADTLITTGEIEDHPLVFTRTMTFLSDRIEVVLEVTAISQVELDDLSEVIPIPTCSRGAECNGAKVNRKRDGSMLADLGTAVGDGFYDTVTNEFSVHNNDREVTLRVDLKDDYRVTASQHGLRFQDGYKDELQIGWVRVHLPVRWSAGQSVTLEYSLQPQ